MFKNDWVITITGTLIGVFAAMYLNQLVATSQLNKQKSVVLENILSEIEQNNIQIKKIRDEQKVLLGTLEFAKKYIREDKIIAPPDSINSFRRKFPKVLKVRDSVDIGNGFFEYSEGEINVDAELSRIGLNTIAYNSLKNSNLTSVFDFTCLMKLEKYYSTIEMLQEQDNELLSTYLSINTDEGDMERFISQLTFILSFENGLINEFEQLFSSIRDCK